MVIKTSVELSEQRSLKRHRLMYYLQVYDGASNKVIGHVMDITTTQGLMLLCDEPITVQEQYRLIMKFSKGYVSGRKELVFDATCRWCREDEDPSFYLAGFQIQKLLPQEVQFIQSLIDEFGF